MTSLRSYAGSNLVAAGADVASAQELLGHLSLATTLAFYVKVAPGVRRDRLRQAISADKSLTMQERLDALWGVFTDRYGDPIDGAE